MKWKVRSRLLQKPSVRAVAADNRYINIPQSPGPTMDPVSSLPISQVASADPGSVQGAAAVAVMKNALYMQGVCALQLVQALQQPALATSGTVGTQINTFA